jgi:3-phosphoshikimate 1-carboxyvinyltransferase
MSGGVLVTPIAGAFEAAIAPPGSKSLTNRALVLSALAQGACTLSNVLFADDTLVMIESLRKLGFELQIDERARTIRINGQGGKIPAAKADLFCGNSGTTIRFLTALASLGHGDVSLDGIARMRQRPIEQLVNLLKNLGARIDYLGQDGFPPVMVQGHGLPGGLMQFQAGQSSQFLSAILQVAPYARHEIKIDLVGEQASWPYVVMTMRLMDIFGHTPHVVRDPTGRPIEIIVPQGKYAATEYAVEPDASNASYFLAIAAIHPGAKVTVKGLGKQSLQGDVGFADLLHEMGADLVFGDDFVTVIGPKELRGIEANLLQMPDMAQTLAVVALFAKGTTQLTGLYSLRVKETDRVAALATELQKLGAHVVVQGDDLIIDPPHKLLPAEIDTYDDHRMAMSFAVAGTKVDGVLIRDAACVNKTYPDFFKDLAKLY